MLCKATRRGKQAGANGFSNGLRPIGSLLGRSGWSAGCGWRKKRRCKLRFRRIKKLIGAAALLPWLGVSVWACGGGYFPDCYLCLGDAPMLWAPTANFANEIARLKLAKMPFVFKENETWGAEQTAETDVAELRTALLKSGST